MSAYYPLYLNLEGQLCVVVGGGPVGERKIRALLEAGARVRLVSPVWTAVLETLAQTGAIEAEHREYTPEVLEGARLVFAATDSGRVNDAVCRDARALAVPVNRADRPEAGDFITPSVLRRGDLCLSVTTGGNSPMLAARIAARLAEQIGPEYEAVVELFGEMRDYIKGETSDPRLRRRALAGLLEVEEALLSYYTQGDSAGARALAQACVREVLASSEEQAESRSAPCSGRSESSHSAH